jgi:prepilin peptidase CpaA
MDLAVLVELGRWLLVGAMIGLACYDVVTFRIPNWANLGLVAAFPVFAGAAALSGVDVFWLEHLGAAAIVFAVGLGMFFARTLGGGDVKLLTAAALWVGMKGLLPLIVWVGLSGGALVLVLLLLRRNLLPIVAWASPRVPQSLPRVLTTGEKVPYGVAIAAGTIMTVLSGQTGWLGQL